MSPASISLTPQAHPAAPSVDGNVDHSPLSTSVPIPGKKGKATKMRPTASSTAR
ncbi:hypothetical protein H0H92_013938 [Tricholoma furcatifolium]|nr:hypothetical protein H0H92_013938 [Tricholoma furcatifolium]